MSRYTSRQPIYANCSSCHEPIPTGSFPVEKGKRLGICRSCNQISNDDEQEAIAQRRRAEFNRDIRAAHKEYDYKL